MGYIDRINKLKENLRPANGSDWREDVIYNNRVLRECREGEYLLKSGRGPNVMYVQYSFGTTEGWFSLGYRKTAAWFKKEELPEVTKYFSRGFKLVKLSKNKK